MKNYIIFSVLVGLLTGSTVLYGAKARVIKVQEKMIHLDLGSERGVQVGMLADIYRQTKTIFHPVTGENLGSPRVKIGRIEIRKVEPMSAVGYLVNQYANVFPGDLAEGIKIAPTIEEKTRTDLDEAQLEINTLARNLANEIKVNQKTIGDLRRTLRRIGSSERRLTSLINTVKNMRERMVSIESKVTTLEEQQMEMISQDTAEVGMIGSEDISDLGVLKRESGDEVYIRVGNRMFRLAFEENRLIEEPEPVQIEDNLEAKFVPQSAATDETPSVEDLFSDVPQEAIPWYRVYWWIAIPLGLLLAIGFLILKLMKRGDQDGLEEKEDNSQDVEHEEFISEELPEPEAVETDGK